MRPDMILGGQQDQNDVQANGVPVKVDIEQANSYGSNSPNSCYGSLSPDESYRDSSLSSSLEMRLKPGKERAPAITHMTSEWRAIEASEHAQATINPIRRIVDVMAVDPNPNKGLIKLHLGDPTLTGGLPSHPSIVEAFVKSVMSGNYNGYGPAVGLYEVRTALASKVTCPEAPVTANDIILTSGCSHALQIAIEGIANPGENILIPRPGFPLYSTLMKPHGIQEKFYNLLVDRGWDIDLEQLESLIDSKTKAILVNNPSNPCGAVFSRSHLIKLLEIADRHKVPIIADEIYGDLTWDGAKYIPLATLQPKVPIITCDGIGKRYLVPGWRLGWLIINDTTGVFKHVRQGLQHLAQKIVGPCGPVQGALPAVLENTPQSFFDNTRAVLARNAQVAFSVLQGTPGLRPVKPKGAMYMMVGLDTNRFPYFKGNAMEFVKGLIAEESVYCLPGSAFFYPDSFRLVLTYPEDVTEEACERIRAFSLRHYSFSSELQSLSLSPPMATFMLDEEEDSDSPPLSDSPLPSPPLALIDPLMGGVLRRKFTATMLL